MKTAITFGLLACSCLLAPANARAEPFVVSTALMTSGTFDCRSSIACSGEGTSAITFGSGDNTATLTFRGIDTRFDVSTRLSQVSLGEFELTATDGFTFPTHPANPRLPMLRFLFTANQTSPVAGRNSRRWSFGPGGRPDLTLQMGYSSFGLPVGPNPYNYDLIVYTVNPFPFTIAPNATTQLTADVGVVPEPGTMLLLGTGLVGAAMARRRKRNQGVQPPH